MPPSARILRRNIFHIVLGFAVRRTLVAVPDDGILAGVITGQRQFDIALEHIEQETQVARAAVNVLRRVENILHPETSGGCRHQLHQSAGAFVGDGPRMKARFLTHQGENQMRVNAVFCRGLFHQIIVIRVAGGIADRHRNL